MPRLMLLLFLVFVGFVVVSLIDCISTDDKDVRLLPKALWVLLIILFPLAGTVAWFVGGRPQRAPGLRATRTGGQGRAGGTTGPAPARRPLGPDDDPEFLRSISRPRVDDAERLQQWEADLRRREEELRRRDPGDGPTAHDRHDETPGHEHDGPSDPTP